MHFKLFSSLVLVATIICFNFECLPPLMRRGGTTSANSHPVGCETLLEGTAPVMVEWVPFPTADRCAQCLTTGGSIVFVHGLRGHRRNTWTRDGVCWPHDLLSQEEGLSHARVLAFGYDANIVNPTGSASLSSLFEHSISLLNELARERKQDAVSMAIFGEAIPIYFYLARPSHNFCCTFSRRTHSQRRMMSTFFVIFLSDYLITPTGAWSFG